MNRLDRITSILIQLQSKRLITAREIANRFDISIRTVYRDIQTLRTAGIPIGEEEGKGYFLVDGYRLPPVMFTQEEANALVAVEKMLSYYSEDSLKENYESALIKIKAVLKSCTKEKLNYLYDRIGFNHIEAPRSVHMATIQKAITDHLTLQMTYHSLWKDETTVREINPYAILFTGTAWTTIGFCMLRNEIREFRLDRIVNLKLTSVTFEPDPSFSIEDYIEEREKKIF